MPAQFNQLEPQSLVDAFLTHPPHGFAVQSTTDGLCFFYTQFDLLTTLDAAVRQRIVDAFAYRYWSKLLQLSSCFVGTTVSEYSILPKNIQAAQLIEDIQQRGHKNTLTILKDLPLNSPLLSRAENQYSQQLIKLAKSKGFIAVEGQALAYVAIDFKDRDEYLSRFSKSRRKNLKRKLKHLQQLRVDIVATGDARFNDALFCAQLYQLYLNVYQQSEIHFDLLTADFFQQILQDQKAAGRVFFYWHGEQLVGYNICYLYRDNLVDKYIGFDYQLALQFNLYFVSWFVNLDYAQQQGLKFYIAGWTDPGVKARLGAKFSFTQHLVWIQPRLLRFALNRFKYVFEADAHWHAQQ
ncbi:GNAT family N-acetyltransferase [Acinetobacter larvae]|uniref:GNAT family N-acetyltransferase n=1 Tax=Acinetobacter larvae TaxID=1789224 RepID=A0A1B2LX82_9GAMM|nr:GNAT family N-acetyltransferase [Acinetobacter larvae]AOA57541.1 GNAT family N-acetyltransferase [Acinetobacter larvae]